MITRITRGRVLRNSESRVFELLRVATEASPRPPGLLGLSISRQVKDGVTELVAVTVWQDIEAMSAVMGPQWSEPTWLPPLREAIAESTLEILETVVSSYDDLSSVGLSD